MKARLHKYSIKLLLPNSISRRHIIREKVDQIFDKYVVEAIITLPSSRGDTQILALFLIHSRQH